MKRFTPKLGAPLTIATVLYILCSLFGSLFYLVFPPFLCSIGARIHTYTLILYAMEETTTLGAVVWMILSHLFVFITLVFGVLAIARGKLKIYSLLTGLEILMTFVFLLFQETGNFSSTHGILVNVVYCLWLFKKALPAKPAVRKRQLSTKGK
ncbi:MAG: hypothetical protein IJA49_01705 [Oscillospiraceae bacterium]|nr:hypothetical protein [Oscillospiraceae bacterium]